MKKQNRKLKGFTLIEMIIVIAIIGVLAGVLAPTMSAYYAKSRIQAANADAKLIYNAAQTAVQKYLSADRTAVTVSEFKGGIVIISYDATTHSASYSTVDSNPAVTAASDSVTGAIQGTVDYVNKIVSEGAETNWEIYVDNYIVKAAIAADHTTTNYVGFYTANKTSATERSDTTYEAWVNANEIVTVKNQYDGTITS